MIVVPFRVGIIIVAIAAAIWLAIWLSETPQRVQRTKDTRARREQLKTDLASDPAAPKLPYGMTARFPDELDDPSRLGSSGS